MVRQTTQGRPNSGIKVKIYGTMFLHSKGGQIPMIGTRLQKTQPGYDKGQDTITINWGSN